MNKRGTGVSFCAIAAFLFVARYIAAAIFGSNVSTRSSALFQTLLTNIGTPLIVLSVISLVIGVIYLIWGELKKD